MRAAQGQRTAAQGEGARGALAPAARLGGGRGTPPEERVLRYANFREAPDFANRVGVLAEDQNHHPDVDLGWGRAGVTIFTHKIDGLTESDFALAAKVDRL